MGRLRSLLATLLVAGLLLAACGDDDDAATDDPSSDTTAPEDDASEDDAPEDDAPEDDEPADDAAPELDLVSDGTLTVCSDIPYEPFEFEGDDGELTGFDVELLDGIAGELDLDLDVQTTPFDGILGSLAAGDCDIVGSALSITEERAGQVDFTQAYFDADQSLLVKSDVAGEIAGLEDLEGRSIGVQAGTTGEDFANENATGAEIVSFPGAAELFAALEAGEIEGILQDLPVNGYRSTQDDSVEVTATFTTGEQYGFAVAKGNTALLEAVDGALTTLKDDGTYDDIFAVWFGA